MNTALRYLSSLVFSPFSVYRTNQRRAYVRYQYPCSPLRGGRIWSTGRAELRSKWCWLIGRDCAVDVMINHYVKNAF
ncbi:hypothetical protein BDZ91DRAFT_729412 [Kalaharituber pfeilii]|nr:hypothetical protein BDZ91DRAFT_729412 [Kalaharituber pfeilii]